MKYYEIMETECQTPILRQGVGADFWIATSETIEECKKAIESRGNNYKVNEINKEQYDREMELQERRNTYLMTGYWR